ncbi:MAG: hypothetical protein ACRDFA_05005 [bacterium]
MASSRARGRHARSVAAEDPRTHPRTSITTSAKVVENRAEPVKLPVAEVSPFLPEAVRYG